ncbi:hypothetical protein JOB18_011202 [Solea senegalensis]|uniref:Centrosomal protein of 70 kDa n=1 Tax=Solea senegalensis TaxID=28829 RepID=A0AAV6R9F1_SOLSE|nr:hypothetical protein JOB18_011202 [Solea senegalensis]
MEEKKRGQEQEETPQRLLLGQKKTIGTVLSSLVEEVKQVLKQERQRKLELELLWELSLVLKEPELRLVAELELLELEQELPEPELPELELELSELELEQPELELELNLEPLIRLELAKRSEDLEQELSRQREKMPQLQRKLHLILKEEHRLVKEDKNTTGIRESTWKARESSLCAHYCQLLTEISAVVTNLSAPLQLHRQKPASVDLELAEFHNLLPTLEFWAQQLHLMKELHQGLTKLITRLLPQLLPDGGHDSAEAVTVENMILLVDTLLKSTSLKDKVLKSPTQITLLSVVSHFQKLFGMTSLSGVYPRMNEVYTSLGKMTNTMRTLQDILDLDSRVSPAEVVNQVARLVHLNELNASFCNLVEDDDIQRFT